MSKVSNFSKKQLKDFRKEVSVKVLGEDVILVLNRNNQVHEVYPRGLGNPGTPEYIPLYDFLHGRTSESAFEFLANYSL